MLKSMRSSRITLFAFAISILGNANAGISVAHAANGSVTYTYDALGRVSSASYDTNVIVYYSYDANGNRTQQVINVNTLPLCFDSSVHGNPTAWGEGLWSTAASGC